MHLFPRSTPRFALPGAELPCAPTRPTEVFRTTCDALTRLLEGRPFALYRHLDRLYVPEARGLEGAPPFHEGASLVVELARTRRPVMTAGSHRARALRARLAPEDLAVLDRLGAVALIPMAPRGALEGFVCLGHANRAPVLHGVAADVNTLVGAAEADLGSLAAARAAVRAAAP
jgi:hypothetical protein